MSEKPTAERPHMAKKQKTFYLNEQLSQLVDAVCETTGASFTKITTAALIQYLLATSGEDTAKSMRLAVALERGDMSLPYIYLKTVEKRINDGQRKYDLFKECKSLDVLLERWEMMHVQTWQFQKDEWERAIADASDPLDTLIAGICTLATKRQQTPPPKS